MGLVDLPVELLEFIIDHIIPKNWKYYSEWQLVGNLRLVCSKLDLLSCRPFAVSQLNSSISFRIVWSYRLALRLLQN